MNDLMSTPKRFVLVHGALHGSWCWLKVIPFLESMGHSVLAVDLPGRKGRGRPGWGLTLNDYIDDLTTTVDGEPGKVVLVGHSLGGMSIAGVAERLPQKVERLVFVTAWVSMQGQSLAQLHRSNTGSLVERGSRVSLVRGQVRANPQGFREVYCADCSDEDFEWAYRQLVPESARPALSGVHLTNSRFGSVPSTYLCCTDDRALTLAQQQRMLESIGCQHVITLQSSHSPFLSIPRQLADALHEAAGRKAATATQS